MKRLVNFFARLARRLRLRLSPRRAQAAPLARDASPAGYRIVAGRAATGKTSMMRAEAIAAMLRPGTRLLVITSSEHAATHLLLHEAYDPEYHFIGSYRALACRILGCHRLTTSEEVTAPALDRLDAGAGPRVPFTTILVDDAQNLSPSMIRVIDRLSDPDHHSTTYYIDQGQAIFSFLGATVETLSLLRNRAGRHVVNLRSVRRPIVMTTERLAARNVAEAVAMAANKAAELIAPGMTVALLTRTNAEARQASLLIAQMGTPLLLLTSHLIAADSAIPSACEEPWRHYAMRQADLHELLTAGVTIATVHTARDREADHVVVLDTLIPHPTTDTYEERRRLSTAISRARLSATLVSITNQEK
ncbi:MAG: hypothetical protein NC342_04730 [Pseudoflavonifractor sp.]|nr:hypothetical protein [Alloprevotella sp.]MCM1116822.1 hypothetical protein [Pseudoflavonifractor sp.]